MADSYKGAIQFLCTVNRTIGFSNLRENINKEQESEWTDANLIYSENSEFGGNPVVLNLSDGSLKNAFGESLIFTNVYAIYVYNPDTNSNLILGCTNTIPILADGSDRIVVAPQSGICLMSDGSGWTVSSGADCFGLAGTENAEYQLLIIGKGTAE